MDLDIIDGYAWQAADAGARLLVLPEGLIARDGDDDMFAAAHAQPLDGPFVTGLRRISEERHITLMARFMLCPARLMRCRTSRRLAQRIPGSPTFSSSSVTGLLSRPIGSCISMMHSPRGSPIRFAPVLELPPIVEIDGWHVAS